MEISTEYCHVTVWSLKPNTKTASVALSWIQCPWMAAVGLSLCQMKTYGLSRTHVSETLTYCWLQKSWAARTISLRDEHLHHAPPTCILCRFNKIEGFWHNRVLWLPHPLTILKQHNMESHCLFARKKWGELHCIVRSALVPALCRSNWTESSLVWWLQMKHAGCFQP